MQVKTIYLGYWYQRTTLHLSEIFDFLNQGKSPLPLDKTKLKEFQVDLHIESIDFKIDALEHITVKSNGGITIKLYEDGLVLLSKDHHDLKDDIQSLTTYFEKQFLPAMQYLFSLGAPVPKELAGIHDAFPYFIVTEGAKKSDLAHTLQDLSSHTYVDLSAEGIDILRSEQYFMLNPSAKFAHTEQLIEMLIFLKEFKGQLHHYLNLHRVIWEKIAKIKEQPAIRGREVQVQRSQLESYKKTIELIEGRMTQMGLYMATREGIIKTNGWEQFLTDILQFKYNNLRHTLDYIKSLWTMTKQYGDSAIQVFNEINAQSTKNSVQALTVLTSLGIVNMLLDFSGKKAYPDPNPTGISYLLILILGTWVLNKFITFAYQNIHYKINDIKLAKNLK